MRSMDDVWAILARKKRISSIFTSDPAEYVVVVRHMTIEQLEEIVAIPTGVIYYHHTYVEAAHAELMERMLFKKKKLRL